MSKVLKIDGNTATIGMDNGEMKDFPIGSFQYANPLVGDEVEVYQNEADNVVTIVKHGNTATVQNSGYYAKEKSMNKHIFVWIGTFLFGCIGVDRFMRGQIALGIIKLLTVGCWGIWGLVDWIIALVKCYGSAFNADEEVTFINGKYAR